MYREIVLIKLCNGIAGLYPNRLDATTCSKTDETLGEIATVSDAKKQCNNKVKCVGVLETPCRGPSKKFKLCIGNMYYDVSRQSCVLPKSNLSFYCFWLI